jgi:hypothetical protein
MDKIKIKFYDPECKEFGFMLVSNNDTIGNIKKMFSKTKEVIAYDSFIWNFNNNNPLDDNTTLNILLERGFSKNNDYIIFEKNI